jgi:hypothetical protein
MIRSLLIGMALLALATPAHAKKVKKSILPPPNLIILLREQSK